MIFGLILFVILMTAMLLFALFSNALVIYCVVKLKKLRTVTNIFICNLSVSDILLAGIVLPQRIHDVFHQENFFEGILLCKVVNFCPIFIITSSIYTLVGVSFERNRAIVDSHGKRMTFQKLSVLIILIWIFALAISIPTLLEYSVLVIHQNVNNETTMYLSCGSQISNELSLANAIFVFTVSYVVPVIILFKNYLQVAMFVWRRGRRIRDISGDGGNSFENFHLFKHRIKLVKLLVMVAVIFAIAWFPYFVMLLYAKATGIDASENAAGFVNLFLIALATFSTAYNVVLYIIFNPNFKQAIKSVLQCPRCPKRREKPVNNDQIRHTVAPACSATENVLPKLKDGVMKIFSVTSNSDKPQSQLTGSDNSKPSPYRGVLEPRRSLHWHSN